MNQVVTFTETALDGKSGTNKRGPYHFRVFKTAGGAKFQTFDVDLGDKIVDSFGTAVDVVFEVEKNGEYDNNVIKSIKAANGRVEPGQTADDNQGNGAAVVNAVQNSFNGESDRQLRIMRQSALDRAINTVAAGIGIGDIDVSKVKDVDLFHIADQYIHYFENGAEAFE